MLHGVSGWASGSAGLWSVGQSLSDHILPVEVLSMMVNIHSFISKH
jgi:hypothetical protein